MFVLFEKDETFAPLTLTIDQEGSGGLTGQVPTVALRDARSPGPPHSYFDFADGTFKTVGWTTKYQPMTEVERGHYTFEWNPSLFAAITVGSYLAAEYHLDGGTNLLGDDHDLILIVESIAEIPSDTAALISTIGTGLTPAQATQLMEIWQIHGLDNTNPLVVSPTQRSAGSAITQSIEENVPVAGSCTVTRL